MKLPKMIPMIFGMDNMGASSVKRGRERINALCTPAKRQAHSTDYADFIGPIVSVLDGDLVEVLHNIQPEHIRPSSIDCPEKGQTW
jgi:endonuclease YncB( thermonuclease family)